MTAPESARTALAEAAEPWWKVGTVWLVVGGPATVVVAGIVTAVIAISGADTLVTDPVAASAPKAATADTPAMQGRNHAATPQQ